MFLKQTSFTVLPLPLYFPNFCGAFEAHRKPGGHHSSRVAIGQALPWGAHRNVARRYHSGDGSSLIMEAGMGKWENSKGKRDLENKEIRQGMVAPSSDIFNILRTQHLM